MGQLIIAYLAGIMTVAAPCILPLLPLVIGGAVTPNDQKSKRAWVRPLIITLSLAVSVIIFTLLLKASTALLGVPQQTWAYVSGAIVVAFGLNLLFPVWWERLMTVSKINLLVNRFLGSGLRKRGIARDITIGAALGPVFSSCSPTYALIVALVLPASFIKGLVYLVAYALGLATILFIIAFSSRTIISKLGWMSNPNGLFKKTIGTAFVIVGFAVIFGIDKDIQTYVLQNGWYDPILRLEQRLGF